MTSEENITRTQAKKSRSGKARLFNQNPWVPACYRSVMVSARFIGRVSYGGSRRDWRDHNACPWSREREGKKTGSMNFSCRAKQFCCPWATLFQSSSPRRSLPCAFVSSHAQSSAGCSLQKQWPWCNDEE